MNYPYSKHREEEFTGNLEPATEKQIRFIWLLAAKRLDTLNAILESIPSVSNVEEITTKGQATYVIKCLRGELKPFPDRTITPGAKQMDFVCSCGCKHITRCEIVDETLCIEHVRCGCPDNIKHRIIPKDTEAQP